MHALPPTDPDFALQWGLHNAGQDVIGVAGAAGADISALDAWNIHTGGSLVTVAIVGTGVNPHPEFADRLLEGVAITKTGDPHDSRDSSWSGTHMAGIIAAAHDGIGIAGVHPLARILPVRVVGSNLEDDVGLGIRWAADHGAKVIVIAHQFYDDDPTLADGVQYAHSKDIVLVAPAGHDHESKVAYPARYPECIAVAPTNMTDDSPAWANFGPEVELSAPGDRIWSTLPAGGYAFENTKSSALAAAYVAGVASLIRSYNPLLSAAAVRQILIDSADDLGTPGRDSYFGYGRINAAAALGMVAPQPARFELLWNLPEFLTPDQPLTRQVRIATASPARPETAGLVYRILPGGVGAPLPLQWLGGPDYVVSFPPVPCGATIEYYLSVTTVDGHVYTEPKQAPLNVRKAVAQSFTTLFADDFEIDRGWGSTTFGTGTRGAWARVSPIGTTTGSPSIVVQPGYDRTPNAGQKCFITGQHIPGGGAGDNDVDLGPVELGSPIIDLLPSGDTEVRYACWFVTRSGMADELTVEFSRDAGAHWTLVEEIAATAGWEYHTFRLSEFPAVTGSELRLRFVTADLDNDSLTEAGVDDVLISAIGCGGLLGDSNGDGVIDAIDWPSIADCLLGPNTALPSECLAADLSGDGRGDLRDAATFQSLLGLEPK